MAANNVSSGVVVPVPPHVTQAIRDYVPLSGFTVVPKRRGERSIILDWGVRVSAQLDDKEYVGWICLGSHDCRVQNKIIQLYGNTSKATKHLSEEHLLVATKVTVETSRKRSRAEQLDRLRSAVVTGDDSRRINLLLETVRVVNNNLPFRIGEYDESELIADFTLSDEFRVTVNNQTIARSIAELYSSARSTACDYIDRSRVVGVPMFTVVCDMLSSKTQKATKYLGLRLYFVDHEWKFQSILLGTRHYEPMYGERSEGNREPFKRWILELLKDFRLAVKDVYGSTSDAGPDVKWMMKTGLGLQWEWCMPHLTNAATKMAFGIVPQRKNSKNIEMTDLITRINSTTFAIRSNSSMGSLFAELCEMANNGASRQLVEHKDHRFVGLEKVIRRLLGKWDQLEDWFQERTNKAIRDRKPVPEGFPLADDRESLLQLYGLLKPIAALNAKSQKEDANQVDVLLSIFRLRTTILNEMEPIKDRIQPASDPPLYYEVQHLTRLARNTRALLAKAFHKNFFARYTDQSRFRQVSYIPEIQMLLHPSSKNQDINLSKIVRLCNEQLVIDPEHPYLRLDERIISRNVTSVKEAVMNRLRTLMLQISKQNATATASQNTTHTQPRLGASTVAMLELPSLQPQTVFSEELLEFTEEEVVNVVHHDVHEVRVDEEIDRWLTDPSRLRVVNAQPESILAYWKRQHDENNYRLLPIAARVLFAVPASAAQIERDFGITGMLVTTHRTSIAKHNIDMCSFLNRNRRFVDVASCKKLSDAEVEEATPANVLVALSSQQIDTPFSAAWEREMASCTFDSD